MYLPTQFTEPRVEEVHRIITENALGALVTHTDCGLDANHLPFLFDSKEGAAGLLLAHVARANPLLQQVRNGDPVLVIFGGHQGYISPNWYPGKQETHQRVPTWNYEVVHAHGSIHIRDDEKFLRRVVALLTRQHEATQESPWKMGDAPPEFIAQQLKYIVGIEIQLSRLECKRKLSQHHQLPDREGAIQGLTSQGQHGLAQAMRSTLPADS